MTIPTGISAVGSDQKNFHLQASTCCFFCSWNSRLHETMWCGSSRVHHATRHLHGTFLTCLPSNTVTTTLHSWWGFTYPPCNTLQRQPLQRGAVLECPPHNTPTLTTSLAARFFRVRRQHDPTSSTNTCSAVLTCPLHNTPLDSPLNNLFCGAVLTCPPPTRHFRHINTYLHMRGDSYVSPSNTPARLQQLWGAVLTCPPPTRCINKKIIEPTRASVTEKSCQFTIYLSHLPIWNNCLAANR